MYQEALNQVKRELESGFYHTEREEMTNEEAIAYGKRVIGLGLNDETQAFCEVAIKALEQEPCDDATLKDIFCMGCEYREQEPKTGHWIYDRTRDWEGGCKYECSECGMGSDVDFAYCMRCGAKMIEPQESEDQE